MNERLIAVKQPVPACEQVTFEPPLALMFAEHFHYPAIGREELIVLFHPSFPLPVSNLKNGIQPVGKRLIGTEDPKISLLFIETYYIAQKYSERMRVRGFNRSR